ncbi:MAG: NYN domain-containing protein [Schwartzia sp. (in: firmicutes)]
MKRQRACFLIDGYNVIHAYPELSRLARQELAQARERLVDLLMEYGAFEQYEMTIVFDALFTTDEAHEERRGFHVAVLYTAAGETADSRIERLSYDLVRSGREVHVVTSDGVEQTVILGAGAYRLPARELWRRIRKFRERLKKEYFVSTRRMMGRNEVSDHLDRRTAAQLDDLRRREE